MSILKISCQILTKIKSKKGGKVAEIDKMLAAVRRTEEGKISLCLFENPVELTEEEAEVLAEELMRSKSESSPSLRTSASGLPETIDTFELDEVSHGGKEAGKP